ncbi:sporulation histidine kinase inhibitor Sda [Salsuginibacillus halophilus]
MSDDLLLETYNKALEFNLSYDFIVLLLAEIERRSLQVKEAVLTP